MLSCSVMSDSAALTVAGQAPLFMGFPSKNIFSGHHQMQLAKKKKPEVSDKKLK